MGRVPPRLGELLLVLKGAADFGVDLRNGAPDRTWRERYVDQ